MKKAVVAVLAICFAVSLCACTPTPQSTQTASASSGNVISALATSSPVATPVSTPAATVSASATTIPSPTPSGPAMYSSYAHLVSFDPATGIAQFDYFDILKGDEAVAYLVEHEGYSQADAQAEVDNYADSEFVEKNDNPQLRAIDIDDVSLSLMYQPSGAQVEGADPVPSTASDFRAIYTLNPDLLLDSFFYYIHVESDGHVSLVEQVYWA